MKKLKYFIFSLVCLLSCNIVFAANEVVIKSITAVYDEESDILVSEKDNLHSVTFNDKNQKVEYKVIIENTTDGDISIADINLSTPTEEFLNYDISGILKDDVLSANETKEFIVSLETIQMDGWGRNFNDELLTSIEFANHMTNSDAIDFIANPDTIDFIVCIVGLAVISALVYISTKKYKHGKYIVLVIGLVSLLPMVKAKDSITLSFKINASFESQNIMETRFEEPKIFSLGYGPPNLGGKDCWKYDGYIKNIYIQNEFNEIKDYVYKYDISESKNEKVIAYLVRNEENNKYYDLYLQADGIIYANQDSRGYFAGMQNLDNIDNLTGLDTSNVTDMSAMFYNTGYYSDVFALDLSGFNTSKALSMDGMFNNTGYNNSNFTLDLSNFDTSNVTNMSYMFWATGYNSSRFTLDLSSFNTSNVTDMSSMFFETGHNSTNFTLDLSNFDTSNVTDMSYMFYATGDYSSNFTLDLSSFNTSNVTNMSSMFICTGYKSSNFTLDLSNFDTSNVTNMSYMFDSTGYSSSRFTLDLSNFNTSNVTKMSGMFSNTGHNSTNFNTSITISNPNVTDYYSMFYETATKTGSKITVNYTSATSSLVDKMIATKSSNSNVIKGVQVD